MGVRRGLLPVFSHPFPLLPSLDAYKILYSGFRWPRPHSFNIGNAVCDRHVSEGRGEHTALIVPSIGSTTKQNHENVKISFSQLKMLSDRLANAIHHMNGTTQGGHCVAIVMPQGVEAVVAHLATYKTKNIAVPMATMFGTDALHYRITASGATICMAHPKQAEMIREMAKQGKLPTIKHIIEAPDMGIIQGKGQMAEIVSKGSEQFKIEETPADTPALIIFTSGTTGLPKGALHAHRVLLGHLPGVEFPQDMMPQPGDLFWTPADYAWIGGLFDVLLPGLYHGVPVLTHRFLKFDPEAAFELIAQHRIRNMFLPPTALKLMRSVPRPNERYRMNVRSIGSGGETLGESLLQWGRETFGVTIAEFYGQTEANLVIGNCAGVLPVKSNSMGVAIPGHDVRIVDDSGIEQPIGTIGNIGVRTTSEDPVIMLRYWNNPQATKDKFAGEFLLTGDLAKQDEDGYFYFLSRSDDVIKTAGYRVGPGEVEETLLKHPAIQAAAVIGVPDDLRGQIIKAFVILHPNHTPLSSAPANVVEQLKNDIAQFVKGKLAGHEYPREIEFVDELPLTSSGKIMRKELQMRELQKTRH